MWTNIANKYGYEVEIMLDDVPNDKVEDKEKEFIKLYGRLDLGNGILCNHTGCEIEDSVHYYKPVIDDKTLQIFKNIRHAADYIDIPYATLWNYLQGTAINKTNLILLEDYNKGIMSKDLKSNDRKIIVIDKNSRNTFDSITKAAEEYSLNGNHLSRMLNGDTFNKTTLLYLSDYNKGLDTNHNYTNNSNIKKVIDKFSGEIYISARKASEAIGMNYTTLVGKLNGNSPNETQLVYLENYTPQP